MSDQDVISAMEAHGGAFAKALAAAFKLADPDNKFRLKVSFPEIWNRYAQFALIDTAKREDAAQ